MDEVKRQLFLHLCPEELYPPANKQQANNTSRKYASVKNVDTKVILDTTTQLVKIAKTERENKDEGTRATMTQAARNLGEKTVILLNFVRYIRGEQQADPVLIQEEMKSNSEALFDAADELEHSMMKEKRGTALALPRYNDTIKSESPKEDGGDWDEIWYRRRLRGDNNNNTSKGSGNKLGQGLSPQAREWLQTLERVLASDNYEAITKAVKDIIGIIVYMYASSHVTFNMFCSRSEYAKEITTRVASEEKKKRIIDDSKNFVKAASQYVRFHCSEDITLDPVPAKRYDTSQYLFSR